MRVAIVHDWIVVYGGAERVLSEILRIYPEADLFSLVSFPPPNANEFLHGRVPKTSFIQRLPKAKTQYRNYLPLMPIAIEQFDLSSYDLIISSSYAVAKGVITGPNQLHVCYIHSPIRYAWDLQPSYLREANLTKGLKSGIARLLLHYIRLWDFRTSAGVDLFIANSGFVAKRVQKVYRRESQVVFPPVDTTFYSPGGPKGDYYVTASRLVPYKMVSMIVDAFAKMPDRKLVVIGDGPEYADLAARKLPNVQILGYQKSEVLRDHLRAARAFIFAAEEDFGIAPIEAQACGTPVIAFGRGGARESVRDGSNGAPTGVFFDQQTADSLIGAVERFERIEPSIRSESCRTNAERFSSEVFRLNLKRRVDVAIRESQLDFGPERVERVEALSAAGGFEIVHEE